MRIAELRPAATAAAAEPDPFYRRTDLSLDFYRAIREHQQRHLEAATYARAVTAFGLGLLNRPPAAACRAASRTSRPTAT